MKPLRCSLVVALAAPLLALDGLGCSSILGITDTPNPSEDASTADGGAADGPSSPDSTADTGADTGAMDSTASDTGADTGDGASHADAGDAEASVDGADAGDADAADGACAPCVLDQATYDNCCLP